MDEHALRIKVLPEIFKRLTCEKYDLERKPLNFL